GRVRHQMDVVLLAHKALTELFGKSLLCPHRAVLPSGALEDPERRGMESGWAASRQTSQHGLRPLSLKGFEPRGSPSTDPSTNHRPNIIVIIFISGVLV